MTDTEIRLLALSLYASARRVERLPTMRVYEPTETVEIAPVPEHLCNAWDAAIVCRPNEGI